MRDMSEHSGHFLLKRVSVEWKIESYLDRNDERVRIKSPKFLLSDSEFNICFFHYYRNDINDELIYISLRPISLQSTVCVKFTIGLKNSLDGSVFASHHDTQLFILKGCYRLNELFIRAPQLTEVKKVFESGGTLTVFCHAHVADDSTAESEPQTPMPDIVETLPRNFENIFLSGCYADVSIDVKGKKFSAHRSILSSQSSVFRSMFENDMKEKQSGSVNITDCVPESFRSFLLFLYSGKLDVVTPDNALDLYAIAEKYNIQDLKELCRVCMVQYLCVDSVCDVVHLATLHEEQELLTCATDYFVKNASEVLKTLKWETFVGENFTLANELLIKITENNFKINK